ncbi:RuvC-like resolvase [Mycobacterium phage Thonko]|uniref:RuvC-like resolvase n=1 Tax=Mycobacterium phage Thonko TaxID=2282910 RepID=A0A346FC50_9CAUD|nr:RuvC-like Holliday junction resolvase [Mycobacterium phage Thonko]AXN53275.1 RuvC-like resolvase [Mycobacterium phage Thonko]
MPRILGIDTSLTATGLARIDVGPTPGGKTWNICTATVGAPKPTADKSKRAMARRVNALIEQIEGAIDASVDVIAIEGLAYAAKGDSAWVLPWVFGRVIELAERHDKALLVVGTSQRAKYVTGKGNADKDTVMLAVARQWPEAEVANNNEADALAVAAVAAHRIGFPICEPTAYRNEVVEKVSS